MDFIGQINPRARKELLRIVRIWIIYVLVSKVSLFFPHWNISIIALFSYDLFFLLSLLAAKIFLDGHNNRYVYLNLAMFSLIYVSGFFGIFLGENYAIGNDYFQYTFYVFRKIAIGIITGLTIVYIPIELLYRERSIIRKYLITMAVTLPFAFMYHRNFILEPGYLFQAEANYLEVFGGLVGMNFLALFFIFLYGYLQIRLEKPITGYVNLITFGFLIFLTIDSIDNYFNYINITLPPISGLFLVLNLLFFILVLLRNYLYVISDFGVFYEDIRFGRRTVDIKIIQRISYIERYFILVQEAMNSLPYQLFLRLFMAISLLLFLYYYPHGYFKLSFVVITLLTMIMVVYLKLLIKKRTKTKMLNRNEN